MTTWTPKSKQVEVWTEENFPVRIFDPLVFDPSPIYDTGSPAGVWREKPRQSEVWTLV